MKTIVENLITARIIGVTPQKVKGWAVNIVHPAALHAADVIVAVDIAVEPGLLAADIEFLDHSRASQQLQVAVDSAQTDLGQAAADDLIQPHGGRVRCELLEFLQDDLPLPGVALGSLGIHGVTYHY